MIAIFETNLQNENDAKHILHHLLHRYPSHRITIDMEDCDHILRVEGDHFRVLEVVSIIKDLGYDCQALLF